MPDTWTISAVAASTLVTVDQRFNSMSCRELSLLRMAVDQDDVDASCLFGIVRLVDRRRTLDDHLHVAAAGRQVLGQFDQALRRGGEFGERCLASSVSAAIRRRDGAPSGAVSSG
jgi:hypothetical protein